MSKMDMCAAQLTLSDEHYTYVAANITAPFNARVATPGRDIQARNAIAAQTLRDADWMRASPFRQRCAAVCSLHLCCTGPAVQAGLFVTCRRHAGHSCTCSLPCRFEIAPFV